MQHKKKRDARGIPRDRDAGTAILGVEGTASDSITKHAMTIRSIKRSTNHYTAHLPEHQMKNSNTMQRPTRRQHLPLLPGDLRQQRDALGWTQQRMTTAIAKQLPCDLYNLDDEAFPFTLNIFDVETYQALERGTVQLSDEQLRAVWQVFEEHQHPQQPASHAQPGEEPQGSEKEAVQPQETP
jgi:hypothetical protein